MRLLTRTTCYKYHGRKKMMMKKKKKIKK